MTGTVNRLVAEVGEGRGPTVHGYGSRTLDLLFVEDAAEALARGMAANEVEEGAFNIGSGIATSLDQLTELVMPTIGFTGCAPTHAWPRTSVVASRRH